jgi:YD repeat-containing protein
VIGRLQQQTNVVNGAYTRFEYATSQIRVDTYTTVQEGLGEAHSFQITDGMGRVIATATDHPGSVGGFSGQKAVYDVMGRVIKTSNPAETSASGAPSQWTTAGDDASSAWIYTQQTYDWKGRPLVTTNQDGTTKTASYAGCGCAGGEVITLTDEGTIDAGVAKKRQQKIYKDVLGRMVKAEILNWEGGSVYSTTLNSYNARDQLTQVRNYAGAETSTTYQDTQMTYDGYARLKTRHLPEQNPGTVTTWNYKDDDTIERVTDARGATSTLTYNSRRLLTTIAYAAPSPIPPTATTSYTYDAVGNRLSMVDASGNTTYQYNQLSQLVSESKSFAGLPGTNTLSYEYAIGGALKSLTDHSNRKVNYAYDRAGRLNSITGTNYSITQFVNDIDYRAWNAPRQVDFGNAHTLTFTYNQRLSINHLEMISHAGLPAILNEEYEYYADNRIKYSQSHLDPRYDRAFNYDHSRRLNKGVSGADARGESAGGNRPYNQIASYDPFDHLTSRTSRHWSKTFPYISTDSFSNNRRTGWQYDADGNLLNDGHRAFTYDAAARMIASSGSNLTQILDGDGRRVKTTESNVVTYYLTSSVLGQVIAQLDGSGSKNLGFIYAFGDVLAEESSNGFISLVHKNASRLSVRKTHSNSGALIEATELDPQGANVELEDPYLDEPAYNGRDEGAPLYPGYGNVTVPSDCTVDGIWMPCDIAFRMLGSGAAVACPHNDCGPQAVWAKNEGKTTGFFKSEFKAFANGVSGYFLPYEVAGTPQSQADFWFAVANGGADDAAARMIDLNYNASGFLQQQGLKQDDPDELQGKNNGEDCGIVVKFKSGTTYPGTSLPNGPSIVPAPSSGQPMFGLGFSVEGWVKNGGIGRIGSDTAGVKNPANPNGQWTIDQQTSAWIGMNGIKQDERPTFSDISLGVMHHAVGNKFGWYDHPGATIWPPGYSRFENHIVKVYRGKTVCEVSFHFIQHGNTIRWGEGLLK